MAFKMKSPLYLMEEQNEDIGSPLENGSRRRKRKNRRIRGRSWRKQGRFKKPRHCAIDEITGEVTC